jgi:hypothetical protein
MPEILLQGSRGEEVRRLQRNLNEALKQQQVILDGQNIMPLETKTGIFGRRTKAAVERFQRDYKLKKVDGKVGDETRKALATRVLIIEGSVTRNPNPNQNSNPNQSKNQQPSQPRVVVPPPVVPAAAPPVKHWLFQAQPAFGLTPPPFLTTGSSGSSIVTGQLTLGLVYRTASEGPHWEFGAAVQPTFNSQSQATDPRYTIQLQGSVTYADPYNYKRFHTALFGQVLLLGNLSPGSLGAGVQLGGQISVDIIEDRWSLFSQGGVQALGQWTLCGASGGCAGQFSFSPVFTILGTTIQWK